MHFTMLPSMQHVRGLQRQSCCIDLTWSSVAGSIPNHDTSRGYFWDGQKKTSKADTAVR